MIGTTQRVPYGYLLLLVIVLVLQLSGQVEGSNACEWSSDCNGGTCVNSLCVCPADKHGDKCVTTKLCYANSDCGSTGTAACDTTPGDATDYQCTGCDPQWKGTSCQTPQECSIANKDVAQCSNHGSCDDDDEDDDASTERVCVCEAGWEGDDCETPIATCAAGKKSTCGGRGTCDDSAGTCGCTTGYSGTECSVQTCTTDNTVTCQNYGTCVEGAGVSTCTCTDEFYGTNCETAKPCTTDAQCTSGICDPASFKCTSCNVGYTGDLCDTLQVCATDKAGLCSGNGECQETGAGTDVFACVCTTGYDGAECDAFLSCDNANPTAICYGHGICADHDTNGDTAVTCECDAGWTGTDCQTEVAECVDGATAACNGRGTCTAAETTCTCNAGYDGDNCEGSLVCEGEPDNAATALCYGNGDCATVGAATTCTCDAGWKGDECDKLKVCASDEASLCFGHGTCAETSTDSGVFVCTCNDGYMGDECEYESCPAEETYDCTGRGTCTAIGETTLEKCVCDAGYTGPQCETEIDECDPSPCQDPAPCTDLLADYSCACPAKWSGKNCDAAIPEYADWQDWTPCTQSCGTATRSRLRQCTDVTETDRQEIECTALELGEPIGTEDCTDLPVCVCTTHPCLDHAGEHTNAPCNIYGDYHTCVEVFHPSNNTCQMTCDCADGYMFSTTLSLCEDVNECTAGGEEVSCYSTGTTLATGVQGCVNIDGAYYCECLPGYSLSNAGVCEDVDECSSDDLNNCDLLTRVDCTNTAGSYSCACKSDYTAEAGTTGGASCIHKRFMDEDFATGSTVVTGAYSAIQDTPNVYTFKVEEPFVNKIKSMYATRSGTIVFLDEKSADSPAQFAFNQPNDESLEEWGDRLDDISTDITGLAAVYWAPNSPTAGTMYTKYIADLSASSTVNNAIRTGFGNIMTPDWAYVVTWKDMSPNTDPVDTNQKNTYQGVVAGTNDLTTLSVKYMYSDRAMDWDVPMWGSLFQTFYPARIGYFLNIPDDIGVTVSHEYSASGLTIPETDTTLDMWLTTRAKIIYIDRYDLSTEAVAADPTTAGMYISRLVDLAGSHPYMTCSNWLAGKTVQADGIDAGICPGTIEEVLPAVPLFYSPELITDDIKCYEYFLAVVAGETETYTRCCYTGNGVLATGTQYALLAYGYMNVLKVDYDGAGNDAEELAAEETEQAIATACCDADYVMNELVPMASCTSYLTFRPGPVSTAYEALFAIAQIRGDPHFSTFDGRDYTYNGGGEHTLLLVKDQETAPATVLTINILLTVPTDQFGTVVTGLVAKSEGTGNFAEFLFNGAQDAIVVKEGTKAAATVVSVQDDSPADISDAKFKLFRDTTSSEYVLIHENPSIMVKIKPITGVTAPRFTVTLVTPLATQDTHTFTGLLGDFDNTALNDLVNEDESDASAADSTVADLFALAETWANIGTTLFENNPPAITGYTPVKSKAPADLFTSGHGNEAESTAAATACGAQDTRANVECLVDYGLVDAATGTKTKEEAEALFASRTVLKTPVVVPTATCDKIEVQVGTTYTDTVTITATPAVDGKAMTITADTVPTGVTITTAGVVTWTSVAANSVPTFIVNVAEADGATIKFSPQVAFCNCVRGTCVYDTGSSDPWYTAECDCPLGYTGDDCSLDADGCAEDPCSYGCQDVPASALVDANSATYICDVCPTGLTGDGNTCYDMNECQAEPFPCADDAYCINTAGSYVCGCNDGYALVDGYSCIDIDECLLGLHNCDSLAECSNTAGSYTCSCEQGFTGSGMAGECMNVNECAAETSPCPAVSLCLDYSGGYSCQCPFGYEYGWDTNSCDNIDECALGNSCAQRCIDGIGTYTCECEDGFTLSTADVSTCTPATECTAEEKTASCPGNTGTDAVVTVCAKNSNGDILCFCPPGYAVTDTGTCEDLDECASGAHICSPATSVCTNSVGGYTCTCKTGFEVSADGLTCEDTNECATNDGGCAVDSNEYCMNTLGSFSCECNYGYEPATGAGVTGCSDINECDNVVLNDCDPTQGVCTNQVKGANYPLGYSCGCNVGYDLGADGFSCSDKNECAEDDFGGCSQGCSNTVGSRTCYCVEGYALNADGVACDDINECTLGLDYCKDNDNNAATASTYCTNTDGYYDCTCPEGFSLKADGYTCESDEKCPTDHGCEYICNMVPDDSSVAQPTCECPPGKELGTGQDVKNCFNIDECTLGTHYCFNTEADPNKVQCVDDDPGFHCECINAFYTQVEADKCIDYDECAANADDCPANSICNNGDDGFICNCVTGFYMHNEDCVDQNECLSDSTNECDANALCSNEPGGYTCSCNTGYQGDGVTCSDVDECVDGTHACDQDINKGFCNNTVGSFACGCYDGYTKSSTDQCVDNNECTDATVHECSQQCVNFDGGFRCECDMGFQLAADGKGCNAVVECAADAGCDHNCVKIAGVDTCSCKPGFTLNADNKGCEDTDECASADANTCATTENRGVCTNNDGAYACSCSDNYILGPNNECDDLDGGFSDWTEWTECTEDCGGDGVKTKTRLCDNPAPVGNGAPCDGITSRIVPCNIKICDEQLGDSVSLRLLGLTNEMFETLLDVFLDTVVSSLNTQCTHNVTEAQRCCGVTIDLASPVGKTFFVADNINILSVPMTELVGTNIIIYISIDLDTHTVCTAAASRKKRALTGFNGDILKGLADEPTFQTALDTSLTAAATERLGVTLNLTVLEPAAAVQITPAPSTLAPGVEGPATAAPPAATTEKEKKNNWVIPVAVVAAIVGVAVIVIIVVIIMKKKPSKISSDDANDEHTA